MEPLEEQSFALTYQTMRQTEAKPIPLPPAGSDYVKCRVPLVAWIIEVSDALKLSNVTASHACYLMDRLFVSEKLNKPSERPMYQLIAMICILLASKYVETALYTPVMAELNDMSENTYSLALFREVELSALQWLDWNVNAITPMSYLKPFLAFGATSDETIDQEISKLVVLLLGLVLQDFSFASCHPSLVCAAAVYSGRMILQVAQGQNPTASLFELWPQRLEVATGYSLNSLSKCHQRMVQKYVEFSGSISKLGDSTAA